MRKILIILIILMFSNYTSGQNISLSSNQMSVEKIDSVFSDSLLRKLEIVYDIYRVYEYQDKLGQYFVVMTENTYECKERNICNDSIQAFCYKVKDCSFDLEWKINDFILNEENEVSEEYSISFWTKYFNLDDYNNDGIIDPIIVYGTLGNNSFSDGRIKILIFYEGKKRVIKHQNGTLDFERNTVVDEKYYTLPKGIQNRVKNIMINITENKHGIFPYDWLESMNKKEIYLNKK